VIRVGVTVVAAAVSLAVGVTSSSAADECNGLMVCIPVAGPWVVIPAPRGASASATWKLTCPEGVVGGVDARASEKTIGVDFPGRIGSPVNPGITTAEALVFRGTYVGRAARATSYRPFIGCIPGGGGGERTPTAASAPSIVKPGEPITTRIAAVRVIPGTLARATLGCRSGERLLRATHSVGLHTSGVPSAAELTAVRVVRVVRGGTILVSATRSAGLADKVRAVVQLQAECAR
jgi:hypothetical protein